MSTTAPTAAEDDASSIWGVVNSQVHGEKATPTAATVTDSAKAKAAKAKAKAKAKAEKAAAKAAARALLEQDSSSDEDEEEEEPVKKKAAPVKPVKKAKVKPTPTPVKKEEEEEEETPKPSFNRRKFIEDEATREGDDKDEDEDDEGDDGEDIEDLVTPDLPSEVQMFVDNGMLNMEYIIAARDEGVDVHECCIVALEAKKKPKVIIKRELRRIAEANASDDDSDGAIEAVTTALKTPRPMDEESDDEQDIDIVSEDDHEDIKIKTKVTKEEVADLVDMSNSVLKNDGPVTNSRRSRKSNKERARNRIRKHIKKTGDGGDDDEEDDDYSDDDAAIVVKKRKTKRDEEEEDDEEEEEEDDDPHKYATNSIDFGKYSYKIVSFGVPVDDDEFEENEPDGTHENIGFAAITGPIAGKAVTSRKNPPPDWICLVHGSNAKRKVISNRHALAMCRKTTNDDDYKYPYVSGNKFNYADIIKAENRMIRDDAHFKTSVSIPIIPEAKYTSHMDMKRKREEKKKASSASKKRTKTPEKKKKRKAEAKKEKKKVKKAKKKTAAVAEADTDDAFKMYKSFINTAIVKGIEKAGKPGMKEKMDDIEKLLKAMHGKGAKKSRDVLVSLIAESPMNLVLLLCCRDKVVGDMLKTLVEEDDDDEATESEDDGLDW